MRYSYVTLALIIVASGIGAQRHPLATKGHADRVLQTPPVMFEADVINNPSQPDTSNGDKGSSILRAQILLDRAHFSCGELDGVFGTSLQKTVAAYQAERQLPNNGNIDAATWGALNSDTAPALINYTIAEEDVRGPWTTVPRDMMAQAKLASLGYSSPLEALGERFHTNPEVLKKLNPGANFGQAGQTLTVPNVVTTPPGQALNVVVGRSESSVRVYDGRGKLIAFYVCTSGSEHDPLPIGDWKIRAVLHYPEFHYNAQLFWDAKNPHKKATIKPGPNNPVGVVWIDLSKDHYGIHGTPEPSKIGHTTSHGCIRLTNWNAQELAAMVQPGTPALLRE